MRRFADVLVSVVAVSSSSCDVVDVVLLEGDCRGSSWLTAVRRRATSCSSTVSGAEHSPNDAVESLVSTDELCAVEDDAVTPDSAAGVASAAPNTQHVQPSYQHTDIERS